MPVSPAFSPAFQEIFSFDTHKGSDINYWFRSASSHLVLNQGDKRMQIHGATSR